MPEPVIGFKRLNKRRIAVGCPTQRSRGSLRVDVRLRESFGENVAHVGGVGALRPLDGANESREIGGAVNSLIGKRRRLPAESGVTELVHREASPPRPGGGLEVPTRWVLRRMPGFGPEVAYCRRNRTTARTRHYRMRDGPKDLR